MSSHAAPRARDLPSDMGRHIASHAVKQYKQGVESIIKKAANALVDRGALYVLIDTGLTEFRIVVQPSGTLAYSKRRGQTRQWVQYTGPTNIARMEFWTTLGNVLTPGLPVSFVYSRSTPGNPTRHVMLQHAKRNPPRTSDAMNRLRDETEATLRAFA